MISIDSPRSREAVKRSQVEQRCRFLLLWGVLALPNTAHAQASAAPLATAEAPLVFRNVTVVDVRDGRRRPNQAVVIVDRRITTVVPANKVRIPPHARVIEARGKYMIPGLSDLHVHAMEHIGIFAPLFIANGVTAVRDAGSNASLTVQGQWKREIASGSRVGPRLFVSGPSVYESTQANQLWAVSNVGRDSTSQFLYVPASSARRVVDSLREAGADFVKMYSMSREMQFALAAEARRVGILVGGHSDNVSGLDISDSGVAVLDHQTWFTEAVCGSMAPRPDLSSFNTERCAAAARHLRRNNTWVTIAGPTSVGEMGATAYHASFLERGRRYAPVASFWPDLSGLIADSPGVAQYPGSTAEWRELVDTANDSTMNQWLRAVSKMHQARVPLVIGTDANFLMPTIFYAVTPGASVHEMLMFFVLAGMTPLEALQTATLNPAKALRLIDSSGTVEAGRVADIVLLDADPLTDIRNTTAIRAVVANGRYYDRAALNRLLGEAEQPARRSP